MSQSTEPRAAKPSKVELAKSGSRHLRGTIAETLAGDSAGFEHDDVQALKFHGVYQQEDRDGRVERIKQKLTKEHMFMVRTKLPGGVLSADQYLAMDELAERYSYNRSLRITTRQGFQLHGVAKGDLKATIRGINDALISTLAACGDVERNVVASPTPLADAPHRRVKELAAEIARELCPATGAYHEIWLDGEKVASSGEEEPFYGDAYLPRKFKTGIALPDDNSVDVHSHDCGLIAIVEDGRLVGANLLVGGGLGMSHKKPDTYARLGSPVGFVPAERIVAAVRAVAAVFRDHGNRSDRKHARLKYMVEAWGMERFRQVLEEEAGFAVEPWRETGELEFADHLGPHPQGDGRFFYGLFVENGRIMDAPAGPPLKTALAEIVRRLSPGVVLTPTQNLFFTDLEEPEVAELEAILDQHGVARPLDLPAVRRYAMACPALPTCALALAEAERALPEVLSELEAELARLGLDDEPLAVRMTGCPNGCARPYTADVGLVGHGPGFYDVFVGGRLTGDRMADLYDSRVQQEEIVATLKPLLAAWSRDRLPEEGLGDFYQRAFGSGEHRTLLTGDRDDTARGRVQERLVVVA